MSKSESRKQSEPPALDVGELAGRLEGYAGGRPGVITVADLRSAAALLRAFNEEPEGEVLEAMARAVFAPMPGEKIPPAWLDIMLVGHSAWREAVLRGMG